MIYSIAVRRIDPRLFFQTGVAILIWPVRGAQPTATVFTSNGTFSALLIGVPEGLHELINLGSYRAQYSRGFVTISLWLPSRRYA